jgi:hypothetical protein
MAWEYKIVTSSETEDDETMLNELGGDGWELVSVHVSEVSYIEESEDGEEGDEYAEETATYYLKRAKS